ncbi:MAG: HTH-type transcriptional activator RhaS [Lentisphaerae bacterium ADurb.Bin242]|nr:MAG: HTH-type transcriptional activator RhaS [Lentisphaerae bacterium ADurb.Bin242]
MRGQSVSVPAEMDIREIEVRPPPAETAQRLRSFSPYIRQSGDSIRPKWFLGERKLLDYLIVCIGSGKGVFSVDRKEFEVVENDLVWIPPDTLHWMRGTSEEMHCIYLHFDLLYDPGRSHWNAYVPPGVTDLSKYSERMHPKVSDPLISQWKGKIISGVAPSIKSLFRRICHVHEKFPWQRLCQAGLFMQMLEEILAGAVGQQASGEPHAALMQQALAHIQSRLDAELDVEAMAETFRMSASYLRKIFKAHFGVSPRTMHRELRIWRACEMLAYSGLNVSETADRLGFSGVQNFSRAFREVTSNSPRFYRGR